MTELAPAAEQMGFESLWVAEHSHIPTSRLSPWPGGAELPKHYWHSLDPFVALTVAAMASKTIRVATGICLLIERDPIQTAKETASLDTSRRAASSSASAEAGTARRWRTMAPTSRRGGSFSEKGSRRSRPYGHKTSRNITEIWSTSAPCGRGRSRSRDLIRP